jgi:hypothetical protein
MRFRSPFLAASPGPTPPGSSRVRTWSRWIVGGLLAFGIYFALVVAMQSRDRDHWLNHLHDSVYLPLKGYLYTLNYPRSLVRLGFAGTLVTLILYSLLTGHSLVTRPYRAFARRVLTLVKPALVVGIARLFRDWFGARHEALRLVASSLREQALLEFDRAPVHERERRLKAALHSTLLVLRLEALFPATASERQAVSAWTEAMTRGVMTMPRDREKLRKLLRDLADSVDIIVPPRLLSFDLIQWQSAAQEAPFTPQSVAIDVLHVAALVRPDLEQRITSLALGREAKAGDVLPDLTRRLVTARLANSTARRREALEQFTIGLESRAFNMLRGRGRPAAIPEEWHVAAGAASLDLALLLAALADAPEPALAYIDAIEAQNLARTLLNDATLAQMDQNMPRFVRRLDEMFASLPRVQDFKFVAEFEQANVLAREAAWSQSALREGAFLDQHDFEQAHGQVHSLASAAGIDRDELKQ